MEPLKLLFEGRAKTVYRVNDSDRLVQRFRDDITACGGVKKATIAGHGALSNAISCSLFKYLENCRIKTHFIQQLNETDMMVRGMHMIPLLVVVRNRVAGSLVTRLGLDAGLPLHHPVVEFHYRRRELGDPLLNFDHIEALGIAEHGELVEIRALALDINSQLVDFFGKCGIRMVDVKLEFGRVWTDRSLRLGDSLCPDVCRLWDLQTGEPMDKDVFRKDLGNLAEQYAEVMSRISIAYPNL